MATVKEIVVPEGAALALHEAMVTTIPGGKQLDYERAAVTAVLRWLSENPIEASFEDWTRFCAENPGVGPEPFSAWWQRRMFLAPDTPAGIADLLWEARPFPSTGMEYRHDEAVKEAYRRGQQSR